MKSLVFLFILIISVKGFAKKEEFYVDPATLSSECSTTWGFDYDLNVKSHGATIYSNEFDSLEECMVATSKIGNKATEAKKKNVALKLVYKDGIFGMDTAPDFSVSDRTISKPDASKARAEKCVYANKEHKSIPLAKGCTPMFSEVVTADLSCNNAIGTFEFTAICGKSGSKMPSAMECYNNSKEIVKSAATTAGGAK